MTLPTTASVPPVANDDSATTDEDTAVGITLTASDVDGDTLTYSMVTGPSHGALTGTAPNLPYRPGAENDGADSFTFKANDGTADSNTALISITVSEAAAEFDGEIRLAAPGTTFTIGETT